MCILCVASKWSRRIVTMLPWLIIPLIILWALSQLLPPGFRFEVTSPRLACVGVLLISLGWYELAMPRLSVWRAKRSALMRERRRIEAQEAAKWRKEATRRCRNCFSAYRDQTPVGGKFMCTVCGHISKRPFLGTEGLSPGGPLPGIPSANVAESPGGFFGSSQASRGWGRGWPDRGGLVAGGRGWTSSKGWSAGAGMGWGGPTNWSGRRWTSTGPPYWQGGTAPGGGWGGGGYGGSFLGSESCVAGDPHQGRLFDALFQCFSFIFFCLKGLCRILSRREGPGEDGSVNGGRRGGKGKGEDGGIPQGSRGDKARRKAEEKRQARLEREQLEAEERRQREEVARLVEERRRLRDEKLEAEKESEREAAAEREREIRREREAERRRQEKVKEKERELAKEKSRDSDFEEAKKRKEKKDADKKNDSEKKLAFVQNGGDLKKGMKSSRVAAVDIGPKSGDAGAKVGNGKGGGASRYVGSVKGTSNVPPKTAGAHQNNTSSSFWRKGLTGGKSAKGAVHSVPAAGQSTSEAAQKAKSTDSSYSPWNRMPWTKVWGKSNLSTTPVDNVAPQTAGALNMSGPSDTPTQQNGAKLSTNDLNGTCVSDLSQSPVEVKQASATPSPARSWQRLFSNSNAAVQPIVPKEQELEESAASYAEETESIHSEGELSICFGHDLPCSPVSKSSLVTPVGPPVQSPALSFMSIGSSAANTFALPPPVVPNPIAKPVQMPVHPPVSGPLHMSAPIQLPVPITSQNQSHVPQDQLPQILEPWAKPPLSLDAPTDVSAGDKWQMWDSPQLDQIQLSTIAEPLNCWTYLSNGFREQDKDQLRPLTQSLDPEIQLPSSFFSLQPLVNPGCTSGDMFSPLPVGNSQSLWSNHSAFESTMRIWDDSDSQQRAPPEFVDCITQEVMMDPVITADGHSYEREAIERWLRTHDTSPITGEVLPAPQGGYGSGVDKTLRPNHILRGQIIEYRESVARLNRGSVLENSNREKGWSLGLGLGGSAWSTERPQYTGFYTTPGTQSVWSYNGSQNPVSPPL